MDLQLPEWIVDIQRQARDLSFGRVPLEMVISNGQVTKVIGSKTGSTKFSSNDDAILYIVDYIRTTLAKEAELPDDDPRTGGTITLSITHKKGKVKLVNTFDNIEYNYPMY